MTFKIKQLKKKTFSNHSAGNTNGDVSIWNVSSSSCLPSSPYAESVQQPLHQFTAHQDCTNGVG